MIKISKLIVLIITLTLFMARIPPQSSMYCFKSLSRYSKTRVKDFSVWTMSCKVTVKRNIKMLLLQAILKMNFIIVELFGGIYGKSKQSFRGLFVRRVLLSQQIVFDNRPLKLQQKQPAIQLQALVHQSSFNISNFINYSPKNQMSLAKEPKRRRWCKVGL